MNKPESNLYARLSRALVACPIELKRVENSMDTGTPDVFYTSKNNEGWIELKYIKKFPVRLNTTIKVPFRAGQYAWVKRRLRLNNKTTNVLVIQIENTLFVFKDHSIQEEYTRKELVGLCSYQHDMTQIKGTPIFKELDSWNMV
jgi:hypothetical protein